MSDFMGVPIASEPKLPMQAPAYTEGNGVSPHDDLSGEIVENNADSGITPGANPALSVQQLGSLFPYSSGAGSSALLSGGFAAPNHQPVAPTSMVPTAAPAPQVSGQDLSLLSLFNYLTPSDMATPLNDPNVLGPTPFAPGQSAYTLQQQRGLATTKPGATLIPPTIAGTIPVTSLPAAALHLPLQPQITQHALLQQLASAYSAGGQPAPVPPAAAAGAGPMPAAFVGGLIQPMVTANPPDLNFLMAAGYSASLNPGLAMIPAALNPGMAGVQYGLGPFSNMGNFMWNPSVMMPMAASYAMASMPQQLAAMQEQQNRSLSSPLGPNSKPLIKSREARWLIRYNELLQVNNHVYLFTFQSCSIRPRNTTSNSIFDYVLKTVPFGVRPLPRSPRLCHQSETVMVGHEPTRTMVAPKSGQKVLVDR